MYTALEGNFNWYDSVKSFTPANPFYTQDNSSSISVSENKGWQVSFIPGLLISPRTMVFARVGYGNELYKTSYNTNIPVVRPQYMNTKDWVSELIIGLGFNQKLTEQLSFRIEYKHIKPSSNIAGPSGATDGVPGPGPEIRHLNNHQNHYNLHSHVGLISLIYYPSIFN